MASSDTISAKARLLQTVDELFYREGPRSVGVDTVVAASGIAKTTLYRHYPSKDDLIVAYLERRDARYWAWWNRTLEQADPAQHPILAIFQGLVAVLQGPGCAGCAFLVTVAEFPDPSHPGHAFARAHKARVQAQFTALAARTGLRDPDVLGAGLLMLSDGAYAQRRMFGADFPWPVLTDVAAGMVQAHTPPSSGA